MAISAIALRRARYSWSRKPGWSGSSCTREMSTWSRKGVGSMAVITSFSPRKEIKNRPPILLGLMAGFRNLSLVLDSQCTPTAHRLTVPPIGERAVIVIMAMQALAHDSLKRIDPSGADRQGESIMSGGKPLLIRI